MVKAEKAEKAEATAPISFKDKIIEFKIRAAKLPKTGWNAAQSYKYHQSDDVFALVNKCETELRLMSTSNYELVKEYIYENKDKKNFISIVKITITLGDVDSGESVTFSAFGKGWDNTDKDMGKASTDARKEAWFSFLSISTGPAYEAENDEDDSGTGGNNQPEPRSPEPRYQPQQPKLEVTIKKQEQPPAIKEEDFKEPESGCKEHPDLKLNLASTHQGPFWNCPKHDMKPFAAVKKAAS